MGREDLWGEEIRIKRPVSLGFPLISKGKPPLKSQVSESHWPIKFRFRCGAVVNPRNLEPLE